MLQVNGFYFGSTLADQNSFSGICVFFAMAFLFLPCYWIAWFIDVWKFHWTLWIFCGFDWGCCSIFSTRMSSTNFIFLVTAYVLYWCPRPMGTSPKCSSDSRCCVIPHWMNSHVVALLFTCFVCLKLCSFKQNFKIIVDDGGNFSLGNWTLSGAESLTKGSSKHAFLFHGYWWIPQFEMVQVL